MGVTPSTRTAAFFDLDHTLLSRSSGELYLRRLRREGLLTAWDLTGILGGLLLYGLRVVRSETLMDRFAARYRNQLEEDMIAFCRAWFDDTVRHHFYEEAVEILHAHRAAGHVVALLTAATPYVAYPTAVFLGVEHVLCTRLEVQSGRFTGRIVRPVCHGHGKLLWASRFCAEHDLDLADSHFYTDSARDLPVLAAVGHPVPVNPDRRLLREARRRGWPVKRFQRLLDADAAGPAQG